jgi:hypothetical protein
VTICVNDKPTWRMNGYTSSTAGLTFPRNRRWISAIAMHLATSCCSIQGLRNVSNCCDVYCKICVCLQKRKLRMSIASSSKSVQTLYKHMTPHTSKSLNQPLTISWPTIISSKSGNNNNDDDSDSISAAKRWVLSVECRALLVMTQHHLSCAEQCPQSSFFFQLANITWSYYVSPWADL